MHSTSSGKFTRRTLLLLFAVLVILLVTADSYHQPVSVWIPVENNPISTALIQQEADNGHFPELLDPEKVAADYIQNNLELSEVKDFKTGKVTTLSVEMLALLKDGRRVDITLTRPVRKDEEGIWMVQKYRIRKSD